MTILLADDNPDVLDTIELCLELEGHSVLRANDGTEALAIWRARSRDIDLILTDIQMPRLGGVDLAAAIRSRQPDARIIFVSAHADAPDVPPGALAICKPFARRDLLGLIARAGGPNPAVSSPGAADGLGNCRPLALAAC